VRVALGLFGLLLLLARDASGATSAAATTPATTQAAADLRVMTFNIRLATAKDGLNAWPLRKELLFRTVETFDPDLLGMQEVLPTQGEELKARLARTHEFYGVPRNDGKTTGEMAAVFFRRERFEKLREGTFWLSETPEKVGSKGWDAALPRVATWVELRDRRNDGRRVLFLNTHFDHVGKTARVESAKLLRRRLIELAGGDGDNAAVIVTGDFNSAQDSPAYHELLGPAGGPLPLIDTFAEAHPRPTADDFTFHGFTGHNKSPTRIDWILRSDRFGTIGAEIDRANENGRYPSDHFPVTAVVRWK
jgi:endonuclease/exonuclease/phosphatase family metal-dependent hydrolase